MVFIRGPHPAAEVWRSFRRTGDGFSFRERDGICEALVMANADRVVELYLALVEHLPPAVRVELHDLRAGARWHGDDQAVVDARDALARLKGTLAGNGGVEFTLVGADDQLTLTANLEIFIYARSDRWLYLLQGKGLRRLARLRPRSWRLAAGEFAPAPAVCEAVREAADRLGLERAAEGP